MNFIRKAIRWILQLALGALLLMAIFMMAVYFVLQRDPNEIAKEYLGGISRSAGLEFTFGAINVTLLPLPTLSISNLEVTGAKLDFKTAWITARPNFPQLLRGKILPGKISLLRPKLYLKTSLPLGDPAEMASYLRKEEPREAADPEIIKKYLSGGCEIEITQGEAHIAGMDGATLIIAPVRGVLEADASFMLGGDLNIGAARFYRQKENIFNLENFILSGAFNPPDFRRATSRLRASGNIRCKGRISSSSFRLSFTGLNPDWAANLDFRGDIILDDDIVPLAISGKAESRGDSSPVSLQGIEWRLGADSGSLDATLRLPGKTSGFELSGTFLARRASLTEWLGFARNLPPGLQLSLDNVLSAKVDFSLNSRGLQAPHVEAVCVGARFTGKGSVASFAKPVVFLDLKTKSANLGLSLPESLAISPIPPFFAHAPLTPTQASPRKPGETGIDYDIRLSAENLKYGPVKITKATLRIYPGKMDRSGLEDVLLSGKGNLYGGTASGECILGADPSLPYAITGVANNINGALLAKVLPVLPLRQGILRGNASVTSKSKELDVFLANLRGNVELGADKVLLRESKNVFGSLGAKIAIKRAYLEKDRFGMDAAWRLNAKNEDFSSDLQLDGKLWFGGKKREMSFAGLPGAINFTLLKPLGALPKNTNGKLKGILSGGSAGGEFSCKDGTYEFCGLAGKLTATVDAAKSLQWRGEISAASPNLAKTIAMFTGKSDFPPPAWRKFSLTSAFKGSPDTLKLTNIKAKMGEQTISGHIYWEEKDKKPCFDFGLSLNNLNLQPFADSAAKTGGGRWNFSHMRSFNAKGQLDAQNVRGWDVHIQNLRLPLKLENGSLSLGPASGKIYGAPLRWRATVEFKNGLSFNCAISAHDFDLGAAARDRKIQSVLTGRSNLDANMRASLTGPGQLIRALNGDWSFSIRDGSWQGKSKSGELKGKPTRFSLASASGAMTNGVLKSGNVNLRGNDLRVNGGGWLNLPENKIDCEFNVNMGGLPEFPLRLYGPLNKPKTSIGAGKMVINAIGGLTNSIVNVLGGIVDGVWNIFR